jgi:hypothetical protein
MILIGDLAERRLDGKNQDEKVRGLDGKKVRN